MKQSVDKKFDKKLYISCTADPVLLSGFTRSVDDKLSRVRIVSCYCFNASNLKAQNPAVQ